MNLLPFKNRIMKNTDPSLINGPGKGACGSLLLGCLLVASCVRGFAVDGPPEVISYQGFLKDDTGAVITGENHEIVFRIYDAESDGNIEWSEFHTVTVDEGYFSVMLGLGGAVDGENGPDTADLSLASVFADSERWIGLTVDDDDEIEPRLKFLASPYAFTANEALTAKSAESVGDGFISISGTEDTGDVLISVEHDASFSGPVEFLADSEASLTAGTGVLRLGLESDENVILDRDEIQARDDGASSPLTLNPAGGNVVIGGVSDGSSILELKSNKGQSTSGDEGAFRIVHSTGLQLSMDPNEIEATSSGSGATLYLNRRGEGTVQTGGHLVVDGNHQIEGELIALGELDLRGGVTGDVVTTGALGGASLDVSGDVVVDDNAAIAGWLTIGNPVSWLNGDGSLTTTGEALIGGKITIDGVTDLDRFNPSTGERDDDFPVSGGGLVIGGGGEKYITIDTNEIQAADEDGDPSILYLNLEGGEVRANSVVLTSDRRKKKDIQTLQSGVLDRLMELRAKSFRYRYQEDRESASIGFIAQDVEGVFPNLVSRDEEYLALNYNSVGVLAVSGLQELREEKNREIRDLEEKNRNLEDQLKALLSRIDALEQRSQ